MVLPNKAASGNNNKRGFIILILGICNLGGILYSIIYYSNSLVDNKSQHQLLLHTLRTDSWSFMSETAADTVAYMESGSASNSATSASHHHCLNDDFHPINTQVGVWTMLHDNNPNMPYVKGVVKMGQNAKKHTTKPIDLVVMELQSQPLSDAAWKLLRDVGFIRCVVSSIPPPPGVKTRHDLTEKFAVLHVWAMEVYQQVIFLDADTLVVHGGLDALIDMDLEGKPIGVTKDIRERKWVETFNSGVMKLYPSLKEHKHLVALLNSGLKFEYIMSDQGFLNEVYKNNWHEIGFVNNANLALYRFQREFWDQHSLQDINVIHYTMQKPWKCQSKGPYGPICDLWLQA